MDYLFVYGTLREVSTNSMAKLLNENSENMGNGFFYGKLYDLGDYPGAIVNELKSNKVYGTIYRLKSPEQILLTLDHYEGVGKNKVQANEYIRKKITVYSAALNQMQCWVYLYNYPTHGHKLIESGDYLKK